jgi:hypothetical protein
LLTVTNNGVQLLVGNNGPGAMTVSNGTLIAYYPIVGASGRQRHVGHCWQHQHCHHDL